MSIIRNIDVQGEYISTITESDLGDTPVPCGYMEIGDNVNRMEGFSEFSSTPKQLNEWFGVPVDREHSLYLMVGAYDRVNHGNTDWSNHGAPEKFVATKVTRGDFRPELFPSHLPAVWLEGLVDGDILVINKRIAWKIRRYSISL